MGSDILDVLGIEGRRSVWEADSHRVLSLSSPASIPCPGANTMPAVDMDIAVKEEKVVGGAENKRKQQVTARMIQSQFKYNQEVQETVTNKPKKWWRLLERTNQLELAIRVNRNKDNHQNQRGYRHSDQTCKRRKGRGTRELCGMSTPTNSSVEPRKSSLLPGKTDEFYCMIRDMGSLPPSLSIWNCGAVPDKARRAKGQVVCNWVISVEGLRSKSSRAASATGGSVITGAHRPRYWDSTDPVEMRKRPWPLTTTRGDVKRGADEHDRLGMFAGPAKKCSCYISSHTRPKEKKVLTVFRDGRVVSTYRIGTVKKESDTYRAARGRAGLMSCIHSLPMAVHTYILENLHFSFYRRG